MYSVEINLQAKPFGEHLMPKSVSVSSSHWGTSASTTKCTFHLASRVLAEQLSEAAEARWALRGVAFLRSDVFVWQATALLSLTLPLSQSCPNKCYMLQEVSYFELTL